MEDYIAIELAYRNGYDAGESSAIEQVFERLKVDLKGYIGLNYLDELKKKYESEIVNGHRN